jgi:hypothetical protein
MLKQEAIEKWKALFERASQVDPDNEYDWADLCLGFFLGCGLSTSEAEEARFQMLDEGLV